MTFTRRIFLVGAAGFEPSYRPVKSRMLIRMSFTPIAWCRVMESNHPRLCFKQVLIHLS